MLTPHSRLIADCDECGVRQVGFAGVSGGFLLIVVLIISWSAYPIHLLKWVRVAVHNINAETGFWTA